MNNLRKAQKDEAPITFKYSPNEEHEEIQLVFKALEREHYHKTTGWYVLATIFTMISVGYFIWEGAFTSAIVFVLILSIIFLFGNHPPRIIEVHITDQGVYLNRKFYDFKNINHFWIINDKRINIHALYLEIGKTVLKIVAVQLHDIDDNLIRNVLTRYIDEDPEKEEPGHSRARRILGI